MDGNVAVSCQQRCLPQQSKQLLQTKDDIKVDRTLFHSTRRDRSPVFPTMTRIQD